MTTDAAPSSTGSSSWWLRNTPKNATTRPEQRRRVLEEHGEQAGVLAVADRGEHAPRAPLRLRKARQATLNEMALEDHRQAEHDVVDVRGSRGAPGG